MPDDDAQEDASPATHDDAVHDDAVRDDAWQSLIDEERARDAVRARTQRRVLRGLDVTEAGLIGTLWNLAEARGGVVVHTTAGRSVQGALTTVGADFVTIVGERRVTHVPLRALATLRPDPTVRHGEAAGVREQPTDVPLRDVLAEAATDRTAVSLVLRGVDSPINGTLTAAGRDVLTLAPDDRGRERLYVSLESVLEVVLFGSG